MISLSKFKIFNVKQDMSWRVKIFFTVSLPALWKHIGQYWSWFILIWVAPWQEENWKQFFFFQKVMQFYTSGCCGRDSWPSGGCCRGTNLPAASHRPHQLPCQSVSTKQFAITYVDISLRRIFLTLITAFELFRKKYIKKYKHSRLHFLSNV